MIHMAYSSRSHVHRTSNICRLIFPAANAANARSRGCEAATAKLTIAPRSAYPSQFRDTSCGNPLSYDNVPIVVVTRIMGMQKTSRSPTSRF